MPQTVYKKAPDQLGETFYQSILQLKVQDMKASEDKQGPALEKVPDRFTAYSAYCECFLRLMKEECRSQIVQDLSAGVQTTFRFVKIGFVLNKTGFQLKAKTTGRTTLPDGDLLVLQAQLGTPRVPNVVMCLGSLQRANNGTFNLNVTVDPTCNLTRQLSETLQKASANTSSPIADMHLCMAGGIVTFRRSCEAMARLEVSPVSKPIRDLLWSKNGDESMKIRNDHTRHVDVNLDDKRKADSQLDAELTSLNPSQVTAIEMVHDIDFPITMIQGPPGTGKTSTLVVLLQVLFAASPAKQGASGSGRKVYRSAPPQSKKAKPTRKNSTDPTCKRILLCAPSNAATDELVRRATAGKLDYLGVSVLRIGSSDNMSGDIRKYTLDAKCAERVKRSREALDKVQQGIYDLEKKLRGKETEIQQLSRQVEHLAVAEEASERRIAQANLKATEQQIATQRQKLKRLITSKTDQQRLFNKQNSSVRQEVLESSQLICTTLGASGHFLLRNAHLDFDTVIIDEAAQCTEPEVLIPLQYECRKLILVGDPMQLRATVVSLKAKTALLDQSLFERLQKLNWATRCTTMLSEQYRMHPDICRFPSFRFYGDKLLTAEQIKNRPPPLWYAGPSNRISSQQVQAGLDRPYTFFDVAHGRETSANAGESSCYNVDEVQFAVHLLLELCIASPSVGFHGRVAFITPYSRQRTELIRSLKKTFGDRIMKSVEVGTVDSFQGQERDIIIFSCVRTARIGFLKDPKRMNVGLTRAKHSLFVIGHRHTLQRDDAWRALVDDAKKHGLMMQAPRSVRLPTNRPPPNMFTTEVQLAKIKQKATKTASSKPSAPTSSKKPSSSAVGDGDALPVSLKSKTADTAPQRVVHRSRRQTRPSPLSQNSSKASDAERKGGAQKKRRLEPTTSGQGAAPLAKKPRVESQHPIKQEFGGRSDRGGGNFAHGPRPFLRPPPGPPAIPMMLGRPPTRPVHRGGIHMPGAHNWVGHQGHNPIHVPYALHGTPIRAPPHAHHQQRAPPLQQQHMVPAQHQQQYNMPQQNRNQHSTPPTHQHHRNHRHQRQNQSRNWKRNSRP